MPFTSIDFTPGLDFTAINPATGGDHNSLVELATPRADDGVTGKSINLYSIDTALDVPEVPNAGVDTKWKRYMWLRRPHATATDQIPKLYGWNDSAPSDATYLKWIKLTPDAADFEALVNAATAAAQAATATANTALSTANTSLATANTALTNANAAVTTADAVSDDATNALAAATDAQAEAFIARTVANDALATASAANTLATSANNAATANKKLKYVRIEETQVLGVGAGDAVAGANVRALNNITNDDGDLITGNPIGGVVTVKSGTYKVRATAPAWSQNQHTLFLLKSSDDTILVHGTSVDQSNLDFNMRSEAVGIITLAVDTAVKLTHYMTGQLTNGLGKASGLGPAGAKEIYAVLELEKLD